MPSSGSVRRVLASFGWHQGPEAQTLLSLAHLTQSTVYVRTHRSCFENVKVPLDL